MSPGMLYQARDKFADTSLVLGDATNLPFSSEIFDGVFAIQVLHHIKEKEQFLKEAYRVLRRGASFAIHACSHQQMRAFWFYHYFPAGLPLDRHRIPDLSVIADSFVKAGFHGVDTMPCPMDEFVEEHPRQYLNETYRAGQSTFALMSTEEIEAGCEHLEQDIAAGAIDGIVARHREKALSLGGRVSLIWARTPS